MIELLTIFLEFFLAVFAIYSLCKKYISEISASFKKIYFYACDIVSVSIYKKQILISRVLIGLPKPKNYLKTLKGLYSNPFTSGMFVVVRSDVRYWPIADIQKLNKGDIRLEIFKRHSLMTA